jgi:hypothetical protein
MPPKGRAALAKRQKARPDLKGDDILWIGIKASEFNIQRLASFLMFSEHKVEVEPYVDQLEEKIPGGEGFEVAPMEFDYKLIRQTIVKALEALLTVRPDVKPRVLEVIKQHGGERLSLVPDHNLPELYKALDLLGKEIGT